MCCLFQESWVGFAHSVMVTRGKNQWTRHQLCRSLPQMPTLKLEGLVLNLIRKTFRTVAQNPQGEITYSACLKELATSGFLPCLISNQLLKISVELLWLEKVVLDVFIEGQSGVQIIRHKKSKLLSNSLVKGDCRRVFCLLTLTSKLFSLWWKF